MATIDALSIAIGGLANIDRQLALVSQNVANAATPGYVREVATQTSQTADGIAMGVNSGPAQRDVNAQMQADLLLQDATVSGLTTRQSALSAIDAVQGTPGQGTDLASLLGKLQDGFSTLAGNPGSQPQQDAVVGAARTLAQAINALSDVYTSQRQTAQNAVASDIGMLNRTLGTIGALSDRIIALKANHQSTADLENQRDAAVQQIAQLMDVKVLQQSNGDVLLVAASGLGLPTHGATFGPSHPFSTASAGTGAGAYYPGGGIPPIMLGGVDVTAQFSGGRIGANLTLRDATLPTYQAELDEFAQNLAARFDAQGLRLFTDPLGAMPPGGGVPAQNGYVGFATAIQVNPAVLANPALVRDGTQAVAGSPTGASAFTPNPVGGPAGFTTMIQRVLDFALGSEVQPGVLQTPSQTAGLGPAGTLGAPYASPATLADTAANLIAAQAADSATNNSQLTIEKAVQANLHGKYADTTGVNIDAEMSMMLQLQNAYGANARMITASQAMWDQLLAAVH